MHVVQNMMFKSMRKLHPENAKIFVCSDGFLTKFRLRHGFTTRLRTNVKSQARSAEEKMATMQGFVERVQGYLVSMPHKGSADHPVNEFDELWGNFPSWLRWCFDETPATFNNPARETWDEKGKKEVWVAGQAGSASDKRWCTFIIPYSAGKGPHSPVMQPRPAVIFGGAGNVMASEKDSYHPDVDVYFQACPPSCYNYMCIIILLHYYVHSDCVPLI
eukprot:jgi/Mesvir1/24095/Mv10817-RA.1